MTSNSSSVWLNAITDIFSDGSLSEKGVFEPFWKQVMLLSAGSSKSWWKTRRLGNHSLFKVGTRFKGMKTYQASESALSSRYDVAVDRPKRFRSFTSMASLCFRTRRLITAWWNPSWRLSIAWRTFLSFIYPFQLSAVFAPSLPSGNLLCAMFAYNDSILQETSFK